MKTTELITRLQRINDEAGTDLDVVILTERPKVFHISDDPECYPIHFNDDSGERSAIAIAWKGIGETVDREYKELLRARLQLHRGGKYDASTNEEENDA